MHIKYKYKKQYKFLLYIWFFIYIYIYGSGELTNLQSSCTSLLYTHYRQARVLNLQDPRMNKTLPTHHLGGETDMEATNVDDDQCSNGDILLRTRGILDGLVKFEGLLGE